MQLLLVEKCNCKHHSKGINKDPYTVYSSSSFSKISEEQLVFDNDGLVGIYLAEADKIFRFEEKAIYIQLDSEDKELFTRYSFIKK